MSDQQPHDDDTSTSDARNGSGRPVSSSGPHAGPEHDESAQEEHIGVGRPYQRSTRPDAGGTGQDGRGTAPSRSSDPASSQSPLNPATGWVASSGTGWSTAPSGWSGGSATGWPGRPEAGGDAEPPAAGQTASDEPTFEAGPSTEAEPRLESTTTTTSTEPAPAPAESSPASSRSHDPSNPGEGEASGFSIGVGAVSPHAPSYWSPPRPTSEQPAQPVAEPTAPPAAPTTQSGGEDASFFAAPRAGGQEPDAPRSSGSAQSPQSAPSAPSYVGQTYPRQPSPSQPSSSQPAQPGQEQAPDPVQPDQPHRLPGDQTVSQTHLSHSTAPTGEVSRFGRTNSAGPGLAPGQERRAPARIETAPGTGYDEEDEGFIRDLATQRRRPVPRHGWQGVVYRISRINVGPSKRDRQEIDIRERLNRQLRRTRGYCGYVGIASEKGGVGKTTLAALLAAELAEGRRESVGVADLNPDLGTLPDRFGVRPHHSIRDLLAHVDEIPWRYHVHDFMEKVPEMNVRVLAASTDRKIRNQLSMNDVELLAELFAPFFSFAILDNGTHITHEAMLGTLRVAHGMVLVTDNTKDGANLARKTLQFLTDNGFPDMRRRIVLAVVAKETASPVKVRAIERAFTDHVRELVVIPYDPSLDGGGKIPFRDPNAVNKLLRPQTRAAVRRLAAIVIDDLVD
ncbi:MinD/ParA family protein [Actinopolymorpha pittospori]|uniref:MinD-like ATPase involved in chromosome partitioning or flagellar assembly n=1 Tax=Actinopolymorpha pittospori TaxID=648752 RepID=A0A927MR37_9ACTN|nr:MinD-like ATPase involved in chromosome partitioning or flagellar assembly [Actinopolymorpha pittospori]